MREAYEREEDAITEAYNNGDISLDEHNRQLHELQRMYQVEAEEAAQNAYNQELERW
jgi:hypothetical protein